MTGSLRFLVVLVGLPAWFAGCTNRPAVGNNIVGKDDLVLTAPSHRLVYQRGPDDSALLPIAGTCSWPCGVLEARVISVGSANGPEAWKPLGTVGAKGDFTTHLRVHAGWYRLEVRVKSGRDAVTNAVERVGVGEVFMVVGHSVAQGGTTNLPGATDDRVNTIAWPANSAAARLDYERTGDPQFLPPPVGTQFGSGVVPAPFGHDTYFWAQFAERVAQSQNVPVLLLNAAFGGTSLEHWAKSARGEPFEHSFVKSGIRMPYVNLRNALQRYSTVTGARAILADQGQNDWPETNAVRVFTNYVTWVEQARADLDFPKLAIVVNRSSPPGNPKLIRGVQERMIREVPYCFTGPDYDPLAKADRYDGVHLSESGMDRAAQLWADALTPAFFEQATPFPPRAR